MPGTLFVVATPIGNLEDISARAVRILNEVGAVACEDTRVASKLLSKFEIPKKPLISVHEHSDNVRLDAVLDKLREGTNVAYVCDAGTPGMNDPGGKLAAAVLEHGMTVVPVPGPSALTAAISACGFPMDEFRYLGFAPHKKGRETFFAEIGEDQAAVIFLESTHRIGKTMESLQKHLGPERLVFVGRELTKMHETLLRGTIDEVAAALQAGSSKGEFILVVAPKSFHAKSHV